jgi:hypothetical protein
MMKLLICSFLHSLWTKTSQDTEVLCSMNVQPFNAGIKSLRATLPAEIFYWYFNFLKGSLRDVFINRSVFKG